MTWVMGGAAASAVQGAWRLKTRSQNCSASTCDLSVKQRSDVSRYGLPDADATTVPALTSDELLNTTAALRVRHGHSATGQSCKDCQKRRFLCQGMQSRAGACAGAHGHRVAAAILSQISTNTAAGKLKDESNKYESSPLHGVTSSLAQGGQRWAGTRTEAHGDRDAAACVDGVDVHHCGRRQAPRRVAGHAGRAQRRAAARADSLNAGQVELRAVDAPRRGPQLPALLRLAQELAHALHCRECMCVAHSDNECDGGASTSKH